MLFGISKESFFTKERKDIGLHGVLVLKMILVVLILTLLPLMTGLVHKNPVTGGAGIAKSRILLNIMIFWFNQVPAYTILNVLRTSYRPSSSIMGYSPIAKKSPIDEMGKINGIFDHKINLS